MKKALLIIPITAILISSLCFAQDGTVIVRVSNPLPWKTFIEFINKIIDVVLIVALVLAPLMILIGAFYMTTSGTPITKDQVTKAKSIITYTVIGIVLLLGAKGFTYWLFQKFGVAP